ncbi:endolytic transglycosylase MltG [Salsuginibacillus kocurii]|uniref:endolytic transglycosylase MltG n=1 Tax=Salsuginibacillus kocurii TaxID=427078 RepID=UPI00038123B8|nr:endolytic transglycosylase MltG [Salsuginibacillus kocurii]
MSEQDPDRMQKQSRIIRRIVLYSLVGIILLLGVGAFGGYMYIQTLMGPKDEDSEDMEVVEIPIGSTAVDIGEILEEEEVIENATFFRYYVRFQNEGGFQAGEYELSPAMDVDEIIEELKEGRLEEEAAITFTIPEGLWLEEIIENLAEDTPYTEEEIDVTLHDEEYLQELVEHVEVLTDEIFTEEVRHPLEGYLFPSRYDFYEEEPELTGIIEDMLYRSNDIAVEQHEALEERDLSIHEWFTLASIVEREAQTAEDRRRISGVLHNRLEEGMPLQVDPTVAYAIGTHLYMTSFSDLEEDDPYNTYMYSGLPPGPIASPGEDALISVLEPDDSEYLYFYARRNGEVIYNQNLEEHEAARDEYQHEWIEGEDSAD